MLATSSRQLQAAAATPAFPVPWLTREWGPRAAPTPALIVYTVATLPLCVLGIGGAEDHRHGTRTPSRPSPSLVRAQGHPLLLCRSSPAPPPLPAAAFLRLRSTQPGLARPFSVPGGPAAAWGIALLVIAFGVFSIAASASGEAPYVLPCVLGIPLTLLFAAWIKEKVWPSDLRSGAPCLLGRNSRRKSVQTQSWCR